MICGALEGAGFSWLGQFIGSFARKRLVPSRAKLEKASVY
jgi:hypothetical protein